MRLLFSDNSPTLGSPTLGFCLGDSGISTLENGISKKKNWHRLGSEHMLSAVR